MIRKAAVAGLFYPSEPHILRRFLADNLQDQEDQAEAKAIIVPHAGYPYSGSIAANVYSAVRLPTRFVIICPNHTGLGAPLAVISEGDWNTPLGAASIDSDLAAALVAECPQLTESPAAHIREHSLEVQLPFLQYLVGDSLSFVPVCVRVGDYQTLADFGRAIGNALTKFGAPVLVIASSDMNHFESAEVTLVKDQLAIDRVLALDSQGLYDVVQERDISMCGYGPTIAALEAAKALGATSARLIAHSHSGVVTGDNRNVVGYAGMVVC